METKILQNLTDSLELQKQESQPLKTGNELTMALTGLKVAQISIDDLSNTIRTCMLLVGIRAANIPNTEEKRFLLDFIKSNFSQHTPEEIKLAFTMAVAGKLSVEVNCYENFSCEYFGRIMAAYRKWAASEVKQIPDPKRIEIDTFERPTKVNWEPIWQDVIQAARENRIETKIIAEPLYNYLIEIGLMNLEPEEKWVNIERARSNYIAELSDSLIPCDKRVLLQLKEEKWDRYRELRERVVIRAKCIAVRNLAVKMATNETI